MALALPRISMIPPAGGSATVGPDTGASAGILAAARGLESYRWLLILRFALLNLTCLALVGAVWAQGWLDEMIATDSYHLIKLNIGVFLIGLAMCGARIVKLSRELNQLQAEPPASDTRTAQYLAQTRSADSGGRALLAELLKMRLGVRLGTIRHIANCIVLIGLIGTVVGFVIALSGVDATAATDAQAITPMISTLLFGMAIALYKTLVGSVLNIWLMLDYRLLESGTVHLVTGIVDRGEAQMRAKEASHARL